MTHNAKPYIICHMMSTLDGKTASGTDVDILADYFTLYTKTEDKLNATAWMCGRVTMKMFSSGQDTPLPKASIMVPDSDYFAPFKTSYFMFATDTRGSLRWDRNTIALSNVTEKLHLVIIVTR